MSTSPVPNETPQQTMDRVKTEVAANAKASEPKALASTLASSSLKPGTNVPALLEKDPALRQLLQESVYIQTGQKQAAQDATKASQLAPRQYTATSAPTRTTVDQNMQEADQHAADLAASRAAMASQEERKKSAAKAAPEATYGANGSATNTGTDTSNLSPDQQFLFKQQQDLLNQQMADQERTIREKVAESVKSTEVAQKKASGAAQVQLAAMGALDTTSAGIQYMGDLDTSYRSEVQKIISEGESAISMARTAKTSADLELLGKQMETIRQNKQDLLAERDAQTNNVLKLGQIAKMQRDTVGETIDTMISSGMDIKDLPDGYLDSLEKQGNFAPGTVHAMWDVAQKEKTKLDENGKIDQATKLYGLLEKLPPGESVKIGDITYHGTKTQNYDWKLEVNDDGQATGVAFDPATGQFKTQDVGYIGSKNAGFQLQFDGEGNPWNYNTKTGQMLYAGPADASYDSVIPNGTDFNWEDPDGGNFSGQCGEFVRWATDGSVRVGDSLDSKKAILDKTIGTPGNPVHVGDVMVTSEGGWTGHIGMVNTVQNAPDGSVTYKLTEANYNLDGKIYNNRQISSTNGKIVGFTRPAKTNPNLQIGSDSGVKQFAPKTKETAIKGFTAPVTAQNKPVMDAFSVVGGRLGAKDVREGAQNALDSYLQQGDIDGAKSYLKDLAITGANTEDKKKFEGRANSISELTTVGNLLNDYAEQHGNVSGLGGLFNGTEEQIAKKIGAVNDPTLRNIASRINLSLIDYRNAVSGASFTAAEKKDYENLFPSIMNGTELNLNTINTLLDVFEGRQETFYKTQLGSMPYDQLFGQGSQTQSQDQQDQGNGQGNGSNAVSFNDAKDPRINELRQSGWWANVSPDGTQNLLDPDTQFDSSKYETINYKKGDAALEKAAQNGWYGKYNPDGTVTILKPKGKQLLINEQALNRG